MSAGLGITLLPKDLIGPVWKTGRLGLHPRPGIKGWVETAFIQHRDVYATSAMRCFLDLARPELASIRAAEYRVQVSFRVIVAIRSKRYPGISNQRIVRRGRPRTR